MKYIFFIALLSPLVFFFISPMSSNAVAIGANSTSSGTGVTSTGTTSTGSKINCIVTNIEKRDAIIREALREYTTVADTAYPLRSREVTQAYLSISDTDIRDATVKSAWKKWRATTEGARKKRMEKVKLSWKNFSNDIRACRINPRETDIIYSSWDSGK